LFSLVCLRVASPLSLFFSLETFTAHASDID